MKRKKKNILIVDDDINTSLKYKKWLKEEGFNLTLINDPKVAEVNFKPQNYDLVLIDFKMSIVDGFDLYHKLLEISKKVEHTPSKEFRIGFMTSSLINFNALAELYPSVIAEEEECYVPKHVPKDIFIKHIFVVMSYSTCLT
jgi:CheY-like chemotaxis protein